MAIHILDTGTLYPVGGAVVPTQCLLVERTDGLLAVDAGLSVALLMDQRGLSFERFFIRPPRQASVALVQQVRTLGFDPRDVTDIALTHLHSEHAAGIMDFPHARIHLARREYDVANSGSLRSRVSYRRNIWAHGPRWELHDGSTTWQHVAGASNIDADTMLVPLPGHTAGHCGVAVRTDGGGWLLHAGDAIYADVDEHADLAEFPLRQYQWFSAADRAQVRRTHATLRRLAAVPNMKILCSHKPVGELPTTLATAR